VLMGNPDICPGSVKDLARSPTGSDELCLSRVLKLVEVGRLFRPSTGTDQIQVGAPHVFPSSRNGEMCGWTAFRIFHRSSSGHGITAAAPPSPEPLLCLVEVGLRQYRHGFGLMETSKRDRARARFDFGDLQPHFEAQARCRRWKLRYPAPWHGRLQIRRPLFSMRPQSQGGSLSIWARRSPLCMRLLSSTKTREICPLPRAPRTSHGRLRGCHPSKPHREPTGECQRPQRL
jgi:hypothetical protein